MTTWHAPADTLVRFARSPEVLDDTTASSVEQHLLACGDCRTVVADAADPTDLARTWAEVVDVLDQPRARHVERLLGHLGMPDGLARIVGATAGLRLAWLAAVGAVAGIAVAASRQAGAETGFLVMAPLVPLGAVLLTFLAADDPAGEAGTATPMHGAGLVLRRALTVVVPTFVILGLASLAQPDLGRAALWVLPGIALTVSALALVTVMRATTATLWLSLGWLLTVSAVTILDGRVTPIADTPVYGPAGQAAALLISVAATVVLYARRDRFSTVEVLL